MNMVLREHGGEIGLSLNVPKNKDSFLGTKTRAKTNFLKFKYHYSILRT